MRGLLISFEGGEGAGKGTQVRLLKEALEAAGKTVVLTREPGGTPIGEKIRHLLKHDPDGKNMVPRAELLLFLAARAQNFDERIYPALEKGEIVICDRFIDSSAVYQGHTRGLGVEAVDSFNDFATNHHKPDITFIVDLPVEVGLERVRLREGAHPALWDRLDSEKKSFHEKVREGYLALHKREGKRCVLIDASRSDIAAIHAEILNHVESRLAANRRA